MFGSKQDPWHTQPDDKREVEPSYPQDAADQEREQKKRKWMGRAVEAAVDILGEIIEAVLDGI